MLRSASGGSTHRLPATGEMVDTLAVSFLEAERYLDLTNPLDVSPPRC